MKRWLFAGITLEVEGVVVIIMFVAHAQTDVGVVEGLAYFQRDNVPGLINVAVRWRNLARCLIGGQTRQIGITPDGRVFLALPKLVRIAYDNLWPVRQLQAHFEPRLASSNVHLGDGRREKRPVHREESAVAIIITAELVIPCLDVAQLWLR